jgi:hypothetical protein
MVRNIVGRLILLGFLALSPAGAGAQDDGAASGELARLHARIAELEAEDARKTELIANLRVRLAELPLLETGARTLNNRVRNQILEI